jgi:ATP-dependent exoDNAse (exonuclease V) beta subunit
LLVRQLPFVAGFGNNVGVEPDASRLYDEAARRTVLLLGDADPLVFGAVTGLLVHVDSDINKVQKLLADMLAKREQWLRLIGAANYSEQDLETVRESLECALADAVRYELTLLRDLVAQHLPPGVRSELFSLMRYAATNVDPDNSLCQLAGLEDLPACEPAELGKWVAIDKFLFDSTRKLRGSLNKNNGFPTSDRARKDACRTLLASLAADPQFSGSVCDRFARLAVLPPTRYTEAQWGFVKALFSVLPRAVANLKLLFAEEGCVDFSEVAQGAARALGGADNPTDLALSLGARIQHILVDEFQDTSVAQIELLKALMASWEPDAGNSIFVVGDPMQSIYGFRQAEVVLFQRTRQDGINGWKLTPEELRVNFRSHAGLIEWFNHTFLHILTEDNVVTGAVSYAEADAIHPAVVDSVQVHPFALKDHEAEGRRVAELVEQGLEETEHGTIAILVRARSHVVQIVKALQAKGIPFRAIKIDPLSERQAVLDIDALTRALLHLEDRTSWLAILRAPWCGLELADLWAICHDDPKSPVWNLLQARKNSLSDRGRQVIQRVVPILTEALSSRGRAPLRDWVESTWISLGGPAAAYAGQNAEADLRDIYAYLDLLQEVENAGELPAPQIFRNKLDQLYAPADTSDGIRVEIMTIHTAKGLQFDTVIVPGLGRKPKEDDSRLLYWQERVLAGKVQLLLAPIEAVVANAQKGSTIEGYLRQIQKDRTSEENKRLLYVAATRAKRKLHLLGHISGPGVTPDANSLLRLLFAVPEVAAAFQAIPATPALSSSTATLQSAVHVLRRLPLDWALPTVPESLHWDAPSLDSSEPQGAHTFDWVSETLRRVGTVTHAFLRQIGREGLQYWTSEHIDRRLAAIRAALISEGVSPAELSTAVAKVAGALRGTLEDEKGSWILSAHAEARSEFEISGVVDGEVRRLKIDRTFVDGSVRWIVDFKVTDIGGGAKNEFLQKQVEKYRPDLTRYARVMQQLDPRPVRLGLYFPLLREFREITREWALC